MAPDNDKIDINKSLKDYLKRNEFGSPEEKNSLLRSWSFDSWFNKSTENVRSDDENNTWFSRAEKDPLCPTLSKKQRIVGFVGCILMGFFCFTLAGFYVPLLLLKARKFCLLYSMGSLFIIGSFSLLWGPYNHIKHLCSYERLPFTTIYFGTMFMTLYSALWLKHTVLTAVFAICQVLTLLWYTISYIPGGQTGLKFFTKICTSVVTRTSSKILPV